MISGNGIYTRNLPSDANEESNDLQLQTRDEEMRLSGNRKENDHFQGS
jgi:hypothetical protein